MSRLEGKQEASLTPVKRERMLWTTADDQRLLKIVEQHGARHWKEIARLFGGRTDKQCRERWKTSLSPDVVDTLWTMEEDLLLVKLHKKLGNKWSVIANRLHGRTPNAVKNRYYLIERRDVRFFKLNEFYRQKNIEKNNLIDSGKCIDTKKGVLQPIQPLIVDVENGPNDIDSNKMNELFTEKKAKKKAKLKKTAKFTTDITTTLLQTSDRPKITLPHIDIGSDNFISLVELPEDSVQLEMQQTDKFTGLVNDEFFKRHFNNV